MTKMEKDLNYILSMENLDVHVHSPYSNCCEDITLKKLRKKAKEKNIVYAVTDHSAHLYFRELARLIHKDNDYKKLFLEYRDLGRKNILKYIEETKVGAPLTGIELDIFPDGSLVFEDDLYDKLDIVLGAVHFLPALKKKQSIGKVIREFKRLTKVLVLSGKIHVLAHPFRILSINNILVSNKLITWAVELCAANMIAMEINSHYRCPENDLRMLNTARKKDVRVVYGSDSHALREFGDYSYQRQICKKWRVGDKSGQL